MPKLEVTALTNTVAIQDDFPVEGLLTMTVKVGTPVSKNLSSGQLQRLSPRLAALEAAGRITYTVTAATGDTRAETPNLPGLPSLSCLNDRASVEVTGATAVPFDGANLLAGQTKASVVVGDAADANGYITFSAVVPGAGGNDISVAFLTGAALAVSVTGNAIEVTLNTGTSTYSDVATAINADSDAKVLVLATEAGTGATVAAVAAAANLAGGKGDGLTAEIDGAPCVVVSVSDTALVVDTPDFTSVNVVPRTAAFSVRSGGQLTTLDVEFTAA
jgi:hypothetical protein